MNEIHILHKLPQRSCQFWEWSTWDVYAWKINGKVLVFPIKVYLSSWEIIISTILKQTSMKDRLSCKLDTFKDTGLSCVNQYQTLSSLHLRSTQIILSLPSTYYIPGSRSCFVSELLVGDLSSKILYKLNFVRPL